MKLVGVQGDRVVYEVGSGSYAFRVGPGEFAATEVPGTVGGTVPPTLSLTLGAAASFGAVHARRREGLHGVHDRERDLDRR